MLLPAILLSTVVSISPSTGQPAPHEALAACAGVAEADRSSALFVRSEDIERVAPLKEQRYKVSRSSALPVLMGSIIYVRAVPGMTAESLRRIADCHAAQADARSATEPFMAACPLYVPGASAKVRFEAGRFVVEIRTDDRAAAEEVLARSLQAARPRPSSGTT